MNMLVDSGGSKIIHSSSNKTSSPSPNKNPSLNHFSKQLKTSKKQMEVDQEQHNILRSRKNSKQMQEVPGR